MDFYGHTIGKIDWLDKKYIYSSPNLVNFNSDDFYLNKYLFYFFKKNIDKTKKLSKGSAIKYFSINQIENLKIYLPEKEERKKIINIIEPIEKTLIKNEKILNNILSSVKLKQNFTKNKKIKEIIRFFSNGLNYKKKDLIENGKYKIFKIGNILSDEKFQKTNLIKNNNLEKGDVLTGLSGTIGSAKIIHDIDWVSNQRTLMLRSPYFLEIKTSIENHKQLLLNISTGAAQKNITSKNILNLNVNVNLFKKEISDLYLILLKINQKLIRLKKELVELLIK